MTKAKENLKFQNVHYKADTEYVVRVAKTLLTPIGIWPLYRGDTTIDKTKTYIQVVFIFILMCFLLVPHVIYTFFDCEDLKRFMKVIAAQVFSSLAIIKFWTVVLKKKDLAYCLREMENHYKEIECEEDRLVMTNSAKIGRLFTVLYLGLSYGGALPYHIILPLLAEKVVLDDNSTLTPLPYLSDYVFFVIENSPLHEITFVTQIIISSIILSTNCGIYSFIAATVMHSCCLFEVVSRHLETIFEYTTDEINNRIGSIMRQHMRAIRYAETLESAMTIIFLSETVGCTIIICFLEYGVLLEWEDNQRLSTITYFILMNSIFVNIYILSYIGDRLKEESERVGEVTYCVEWYVLPRRTIKDLMMIIIRASRPSTLTGGKIFDVSLRGFCDICKTSAAYLNFLQTMQK